MLSFSTGWPLFGSNLRSLGFTIQLEIGLPDVSFFGKYKFENNSFQRTMLNFSQKISSFKLVLKSKKRDWNVSSMI